MTTLTEKLDYYCSFPAIREHLIEQGGATLTDKQQLAIIEAFLVVHGQTFTASVARQRKFDQLRLLFEAGAPWHSHSYWESRDTSILYQPELLAKVYCTAQTRLNPGWESQTNNRWLLSHALEMEVDNEWITHLLNSGVRPQSIAPRGEKLFIKYLFTQCKPLELLNRYTPNGIELLLWAVGALTHKRSAVFEKLVGQLDEKQKQQVLMLCVKRKSVESAVRMIELGAKANLEALNLAVDRRDYKMCKTLIELGAPANPSVRFHTVDEQPLARAIRANNAKIVQLLINSGADPQASYQHAGVTTTPLKMAFKNRYSADPQLVKALVLGGAKVSWHLVVAIHAGNEPLATALLLDPDYPIDLRVRREYQGSMNALEAATHAGMPVLLQLLLRRGATVGQALTPNAIISHPECAKILLESGQVDLEDSYYLECTLLAFMAVHYQDYDGTKLLLDYGARSLGEMDPDRVKDSNIRKLLIDHGVIEPKCLDQCTIL